MTPAREPHVRWWFGRDENDPNRLLIIEDEHSRVFLDYPLREELYSVIGCASHTSPPAPTPSGDWIKFLAAIEQLKWGEVIRKAREEVLDELIDELPNVERSYGGEQIDTYIETHELKELIESLRAQRGGEP
jgi:hypothetical protein